MGESCLLFKHEVDGVFPSRYGEDVLKGNRTHGFYNVTHFE